MAVISDCRLPELVESKCMLFYVPWFVMLCDDSLEKLIWNIYHHPQKYPPAFLQNPAHPSEEEITLLQHRLMLLVLQLHVSGIRQDVFFRVGAFHLAQDFRDSQVVCCCSVAQSCPTLCKPMDCSMPGFPVHHHLLELAQTHIP